MGDCTPSTRAYTRVCSSMLEYARVCSNMLEYAGVALQCIAAVYNISCTIDSIVTIINTRAYPRILARIYTILAHTRAHSHIAAHTCAYSRIPAHTRAYPRILTHTRAYSRILGHTRSYPRMLAHTRRYPVPQSAVALSRHSDSLVLGVFGS